MILAVAGQAGEVVLGALAQLIVLGALGLELELAEGGGRRPNLIMGAKWYMVGWIVIAMAKCGVRMYSNSIDMYVHLSVALSEGFGSVLRVQRCE